jgi:predicted DsbA family dithiol-disulfide isomerase
MSSPTGAVIEVFADICCPFAHVGLRAAESLRSRLGRDDVVIRVRAWPLELVNGAPPDPRITRNQADELRRQIAPDLFCHLDVDRFPHSTLEALALANRAHRIDPEVGERVSFALRDALFEEGQDLSDPAVLEWLARDLGVVMPDDSDHAAVLEDWRVGRRMGVLGSPHFVCDDVDVFSPSFDIIGGGGRAMSINREASRLSEFLERCLGNPGPT